jgi:hypothetical protein
VRPFFPAILALFSTGCFASLSAMGGPTLDTAGNFGGEGRARAQAGVGGNHRVYAAAAVGAGATAARDDGFFVVSPELGYQTGSDLRADLGIVYSPRIYFDGEVRHGIGGAADVLVAVWADDKQATFTTDYEYLAIGPRLQAEYVTGDDEAGEARRGLFTLSFVLQWIPIDTR